MVGAGRPAERHGPDVGDDVSVATEGRHARADTDGFEVPDNRLRLVFSDPSFAGLEVVCQLATIDQIKNAAALGDIDPEKASDGEIATELNRIISEFATALVSWNLKRQGAPVPATRDGVGSLDSLFTMQLVEAWMSNSGKVLKDRAQQMKAAAEVDESELPVEPL